MNRSWISWIVVGSIVGAPVWAGTQSQERPPQKPPAERPAQERPPKPPEQKPPERAQDKPAGTRQERVDQAMKDLRSKEGRATKEDIAAFRNALTQEADPTPGSPRAARLRERLNVAISDLEQRAQNAQLQKEDVLALEERILDMRLDNAIENLATKAKEKSLERADFERAKNLMQQHADLVNAQGDAEEIAFETNLHTKLAAAVDDLEKRAAGGLEDKDFATLRETLVERRLDRSLASLERNALAKRATDADFAAVRDALADRGELAGNAPDAQSIQQRYLNALDGLKQKAMSGQITRDEFAQLRTQLQQKAREASGDK